MNIDIPAEYVPEQAWTISPTPGMRQDIYHHSDNNGPRVSVKLERNSRGTNYEISVSGASSPDEALRLLIETEVRVKAHIESQNAPATG